MVKSDGTTAAPTSDYDALMKYIDGDDYLSAHKGAFAERNGAESPWSNQVDIRISQIIPTFMGQKLEITFDILNVTNLLNKEWGWVKFVPNQTTNNVLTFKNVATTGANAGRARYSLGTLADPNIAADPISRWTAQLGVRYTF